MTEVAAASVFEVESMNEKSFEDSPTIPDSEICIVGEVSAAGDEVDIIVKVSVGVDMTVVNSVTTSLVQESRLR